MSVHTTTGRRDRRSVFVVAAAAWVLFVGLAILNAAVRETLVAPHVAELTAHQTSTVTLVALLLVASYLYFGRVGPHTRRERLLVGVLWAALTVAFEFGFGMLVVGDSFAALLSNYDLLAGRLFAVVPLTLLVAPALFARRAEEREPAG